MRRKSIIVMVDRRRGGQAGIKDRMIDGTSMLYK